MDRLEAINKHRKTSLSSGLLATQALTLLGEKSQVQEFHQAIVATSPVDSALYDSEEDEEAVEKDPNEFFGDIRKLRRELLSRQSKADPPTST